MNKDEEKREEIMGRLPEMVKIHLLREVVVEVQDQQIERNKNSYDNKNYKSKGNNKYG